MDLRDVNGGNQTHTAQTERWCETMQFQAIRQPGRA